MTPSVERSVPMTVVIAMKETDGSILIAADGEGTAEGGLKEHLPKLRRVTDRPLAWAASGNPDIGLREFGNWMTSYQWESAQWDSFISAAADEVSRLNGIQRERTKLSGVPVEEDKHLTEVVIAGWLDRPDIFVISNTGLKFSVWEPQEFIAIGSGGPFAKAMYNVLFHAQGYERQHMMKLIMEVTISTAPNCGPPADCWRIGRSGITSVFSLNPILKHR